METINVEIIVKSNKSLNNEKLIPKCELYLKSNPFRPGTVISNFNPTTEQFFCETVEHVIVGEHGNLKTDYVDFSTVSIQWYVYVLDKNERQVETEYDESGESVNLATIQLLPSQEYFNLWENLIYDTNIKEQLLDFASTSLLLADSGIDSNIITVNRVVLLHGPPGTGKTSLCKAVAQKLSIRLKNRFRRGFLLEVNSHSLFSKWFSESGKLVTKMFSKVKEIVQDPESIVFVLVDEVESLTNDRIKSAGTEPSDAQRVVNAVLTNLDSLRNHSNVLILTTSNIEESIDLAFVDRADVKKYIGLPGIEAIYQIYLSCIQELMRVQIIRPTVIIPPIKLYHKSEEFQGGNLLEISKRLFHVSELSIGLSGRTLRKLPFIALALHTKSKVLNINQFFDAVISAIQHQHDDEKYFVRNKN